MTLGNNVTEQRAWNDRLQFTGMTAAPTGGGTNPLGLNFYPCTGQVTSCTTGNVGNIQSQNITLPGLSLTQSYTYDAVNRLGTAGEGTGSWSRTYGYAEPGNQYVNPTASSGYTISAFTPTAASNFDARNRLNVNNSAYDTSGNGNQTAIGGYTFSYDAEGRIITANLAGVSSTGYVYDGDGQRVQKITCPVGTSICTASVSGATATTFVYDASGNLAAEYASGSTQSACGTPTCYVSVDQIGSTRLVTDGNGTVVRRYDYLPSGEEIWAGIGGRTTGMSYQSAADGFNLKFTGAYRDSETYLDFLNARYYSPQQGRFVSPDPENAGADASDPTTWNGYAYVSNNPLNLTDPSGQGIFGFLWGLVGLIGGGPIGGAIGLGLGEAADLTFNTENPLPSWAMLLIGVGMTGTPLGGIGVGGDIIGDVAGGVDKRQPWNEQPPPMGGGMGPLNTGSVFGSGNTGPFIFSLEPNGCGPSGCPAPTNEPDFVTANISIGFPWVGWSPTLSRDRYGKWYVSLAGVTVGKTLTIVSFSLTFNYLNHWSGTNYAPTPAQLRNFMYQHSLSLSGGFGAGASETCSPGNGCATGFGFFTPQAGGAYNYTFKPTSARPVNRHHPQPGFPW